jgi:positive regulator of sigma E activity
MIEQQGKVVHLQGDSAGVRIGAISGCTACDAGKGCGAGVFGKLLRRKPTTLLLENDIGAKPGQLVNIGIPDRVYLRLLFALYFFPLVLGLVGAGIGHYLGVQMDVNAGLVDAMTFFVAVLFGGIALWTVRLKQITLQGRMKVRLLGVLSGSNLDACQAVTKADIQLNG